MNDDYQAQSLFEEEKAVPQEGLDNSPIPVDYLKEYHPSRNRIVIQFTDEQQEAVLKMLGLKEIKNIAYNFEDLGK